jgi:hypothetical protein
VDWRYVHFQYASTLTRTDTSHQLIRGRQLPNGEWLQEDIEGIFNGTW